MPAPDAGEADWLDSWYLRDVHLDAPLDALLFTNSETLYSLVHPFDRRETLDEIVWLFEARLSEITGRPFNQESVAAYAICKTASRRILGCMNDMCKEMQYHVQAQMAGEGVRFEVLEQRLNAGVFGGVFPDREFEERLGKASQAGQKPARDSHLREVK